MARTPKLTEPVTVVPEVSIYAFNDFRAYLAAQFAEYKKTNPAFSLRYFARKAGFGGQSYVSMVIEGKRNFTPDSISKCARALRLSKREAQYFETMVLYCQASGEDDKVRYFNELLSLRPKSEIKGLTPDQFEYLTKSTYVIIREMAALPGFQATVEWINQNAVKRIKPGEIKQAFEVLVRLGLLKRDSKGRLKHSGKTLQTPADVDSMDILNYHRKVLFNASDVLVAAPLHEWDVSSMTVPIPKKVIGKIMDLLQDCREDIAHIINKSDDDYHEVFQINMQLFPVTRSQKNKPLPDEGDK